MFEFLTTPKLRSEAGFGLTEAIIAAGIGVMVMASITIANRNSSRSTQKTSSSLDIITMRTQILNTVDCKTTFGGREIGNPCEKGEYLDLKSAAGNIIIAAEGTAQGQWTLRARCSSNGLDVRAAKLRNKGATQFDGVYPSSDFFTDEMNSKLPYDWQHPKSKLFSQKSVMGLCTQWFNSSSSASAVMCDENQYMRGFDPIQGKAICGTIPKCNLLSWNGSSFVCGTSAPASTQIVHVGGGGGEYKLETKQVWGGGSSKQGGGLRATPVLTRGK